MLPSVLCLAWECAGWGNARFLEPLTKNMTTAWGSHKTWLQPDLTPALQCFVSQESVASAGQHKWQDHLPRLFTQINWAFSVPVGSSTAQSPLGEQTAYAYSH